MKIDLLGQDYPSKSLDQNQTQLTNMYLEADKDKGKYPIIALPTPGLTLFADTGKTSIRAMYSHNDVLYVVAGDILYSCNSSGTLTSLHSLNTTSGFAKLKTISGGSDNNNQLTLIDGTNGYSYNIGTNTSTFPITDVDFPQTSIDIATQDDYVIVANNNSIQYNISNLSDSLTYDSLDFASKIGEADKLVGIFTHEGKLWLFGNRTTEVWYNSGNVSFPFEKTPDTFLHYGLAAKNSVAGSANYFCFLTVNSSGGYHIVMVLPKTFYYDPQPISTLPLDNLIGSFTTISDAFAYIYTKDGHEFYEITFPSAGYTFCFDKVSGAWNRRQSYTNSTYTNFLGSCQAFCFGKNLIGDSTSGKIYYQNSNSYTENGTPIRRMLVSPPIYMEGKRVFINQLQIDVETGVGSNKTFTLEKSFDNGSTWILVNTFTIPDKGGRIYQNNLGSSRYGILFRITTTMDAKFIILGFQADVKIGHN